MKNFLISIIAILLFIIIIGEPVEGNGSISFWILKMFSFVILLFVGSRYETDK